MKKYLTFALSVCAATGLFANIINWELGNVTNDDGSSLTDYDIVFLTSPSVDGPTSDADGKIDMTTASSNDGSNTKINSNEEAIWGTWTDTVTTNPTKYYVAVKSGDTYYAVVDSGDKALTYTYQGSASPVAGGTFESGSETTYHTVGHVAVPEPATAVLALAGVAMLIRRRKA